MGHKISIHRMLDMLQEAQQVVSVYISPGGKPITKIGYSRFEGIAKEYADKYNLLNYLA